MPSQAGQSTKDYGVDIQEEEELRFAIKDSQGSFTGSYLTFNKVGEDKDGSMYVCRDCSTSPEINSSMRNIATGKTAKDGIKKSSISNHAKMVHEMKVSFARGAESATPMPPILCRYCGQKFTRHHQGRLPHEEKCDKKPPEDSASEMGQQESESRAPKRTTTRSRKKGSESDRGGLEVVPGRSRGAAAEAKRAKGDTIDKNEKLISR